MSFSLYVAYMNTQNLTILEFLDQQISPSHPAKDQKPEFPAASPSPVGDSE